MLAADTPVASCCDPQPNAEEASMFDHVLIPLDGSSLAEQVLPYGQQIADVCGARLELICAIETEDLPEDAVAEVEQERCGYLQRLVASLPAAASPTSTCRRGRPAEVIVDHAGDHPGTLIAMASHGYSGMQRWLLGSVAHKVVQAASTPVLLLPIGATSPSGGPVEFERMIIPLDGSPLAEQVLDYAMKLCGCLDMELILVRAYNPNFPGSSVRMKEVSTIVHDAAENYLKEIAERLRSEGLNAVSYKVLRGIPAEQITDFALETPNSLTAMCTHGRHGVGRWLLGSITDAVIHSAEEPVLVIRAANAMADRARSDT
jgi:nucleotide-binding universal stress UspA family protein